MQKKVLILEDEDNIRGFIVINLKKAGYETVEFGKGQAAMDYIRDNDDVSIAILDIMIPDISGLDVCRFIRGTRNQTGIIMLTALSQEADRVNGFMTGADDYVTKPFSVTELVARVDALYRRVRGTDAEEDIINDGEFVMNLRSRELFKSGKKVDVTQVEFLIMKTFMQNKGKALSRDDLLSLVWGEDFQGDIKIVDVNIRRLRLKIEENAAYPQHIMTVWGYGYRWQG